MEILQSPPIIGIVKKRSERDSFCSYNELRKGDYYESKKNQCIIIGNSNGSLYSTCSWNGSRRRNKDSEIYFPVHR